MMRGITQHGSSRGTTLIILSSQMRTGDAGKSHGCREISVSAPSLRDGSSTSIHCHASRQRRELQRRGHGMDDPRKRLPTTSRRLLLGFATPTYCCTTHFITPWNVSKSHLHVFVEVNPNLPSVRRPHVLRQQPTRYPPLHVMDSQKDHTLVDLSIIFRHSFGVKSNTQHLPQGDGSVSSSAPSSVRGKRVEYNSTGIWKITEMPMTTFCFTDDQAANVALMADSQQQCFCKQP